MLAAFIIKFIFFPSSLPRSILSMHFPRAAAVAIAVVIAFLAITIFCVISACAPRLAAKVEKDVSGRGLEEDLRVMEDARSASNNVASEKQGPSDGDFDDSPPSMPLPSINSERSSTAETLPVGLNEDVLMEFEIINTQGEACRQVRQI